MVGVARTLDGCGEQVVLQIAVARILERDGLGGLRLKGGGGIYLVCRHVEHGALHTDGVAWGALAVECPCAGKVVVASGLGMHGVVALLHLGQGYAALRIGEHGVTGAIVGLEGYGAGTDGLVVAHGLDGDGVGGGVPNLYIVNKPVVDVARVLAVGTETYVEEVVAIEVLAQLKLVGAPVV